ncbi:MAG: SDR family NAD(P)-dependent oxidoreductase [Woeseiaceae bacterium]|nr:SDR family NAD(P)-dependent oxidoreductase [Woeseiaceae bacterium]
MRLLKGCVIAVLVTAQVVWTGSAIAADESPPKAVLVTGATSGIGLKITERLAAEGYFVYAGARKPEDMERLNAMDNVRAVRLDVTYPEDIAAAVEAISAAGRGLHGVVNNAGVVTIGPLIETDIEELEFLFDVNVYGPYRVTMAFAPLLLESQGRVVNISSISGILSGPFLGHYSMSKHAIEAYTDSSPRNWCRSAYRSVPSNPATTTPTSPRASCGASSRKDSTSSRHASGIACSSCWTASATARNSGSRTRWPRRCCAPCSIRSRGGATW